MSDKIKFNKLNDAAQKKAIENFMPFYLDLFEKNALDVMTTFDAQTGVMADINRRIVTDSNDRPAEIIQDVIDFDFQNITTLMNKLSQTYFDNGNPTTEWNEWYVAETDKLDPNATL